MSKTYFFVEWTESMFFYVEMFNLCQKGLYNDQGNVIIVPLLHKDWLNDCFYRKS
ncbi:hypothetical protein AJ85_05565 [Alkalihalobacillus alcalophilus ATCC 27647 = CGMCC 1.3604]|uniref:Uncharacterized protein n=1 Tax=Alkalihalobacillus alcalophilus ATCC 27647 = CGMCC 1.3604 TaxID=1218173 RepID=A0A4S4JTG7_ALKAL|nr:hypothetical protein AJ85_05565 [Alkalihalobacillus alcalophilus ATCC 27647 = CGMCC 1.3604]